MNRWLLQCVLLTASALPPLISAPEKTFHVAPSPLGHDKNLGTKDAPFASIDRARIAIGEYRQQREQRGDIVVEIAAGKYQLEKPLTFTSADSGRNGYFNIFRAAPNAIVQLSGGKAVTGWYRHSDGKFHAKVAGEADFRQLWVNNRRAVRARTPNFGQTFSLSSDKKHDGFDLPQSLLANKQFTTGEVELSVLIAWMHKRLRISQVIPSEAEGFMRAVIASPEWDGVTKQPQGDRVYLNRPYWLENHYDFLDAPGEFHLDRNRRLVRYQPRPDESLESLNATRPELEHLVLLQGDLDSPVEYLRFEGLSFAHTGWTRPNQHGFVDVQANSLIPADLDAAKDPQYRHNQRKDRVSAAFQAQAANRIEIKNCRFTQLGGTGVMFMRGGNDNVIEGNTFYDISGGAIEIGDDAVSPRDKRVFPRRNRVANNFIARIGEDYYGSVAILGYYTDSLEITHNEIVALPYTAVSQGWGWGTPPAPPESKNSRITHNFVSNYMRRLDDGGGLYTTDALTDSEISWNVVERMLPPDAHTKAGGALYLDQCTSGVHVHHNVVTGSIRWLNIWNPNIHHNRVTENYADTASLRNDGTDNTVEPVILLPRNRSDEPAGAKEIRRRAGLEPGCVNARNFQENAVIVTDASQVDFEIVAGTWNCGEPSDRYGSVVRESTDTRAIARWTPALPKSSMYEVQVWRPAGAGAASYRIKHAEGEARVTLDRTQTVAEWLSLGRYSFRSGVQAEVEIQQPETEHTNLLIADTISFTAQ